MRSHPEIQAAFRDGLTGGDVPPGVTAVGDVARRFSVYRNTHARSLTDALAARFPVIRRLVGDAFFDAMAGVFLRSHPPRDPLIHRYGDAMPAFLETFPAAAKLPYLRDIARFELLRGTAFHAADADALSPDVVAAALADAPDSAALTLHPCAGLLASRYPVVSIWRANQPGASGQKIVPEAQSALIFRQRDQVAEARLEPPVFRVVAALHAGLPLGALPTDDGGAAHLSSALSLLLRHGLVVGITHPERSVRP